MGAFQEWLLQNPIADWVWEIFKGLSPFIIALITKCRRKAPCFSNGDIRRLLLLN